MGGHAGILAGAKSKPGVGNALTSLRAKEPHIPASAETHTAASLTLLQPSQVLGLLDSFETDLGKAGIEEWPPFLFHPTFLQHLA